MKTRTYTHGENGDQFWNGCIWRQFFSEHADCWMTQVVIWSNAAVYCRRQAVVILHEKKLLQWRRDTHYNKV